MKSETVQFHIFKLVSVLFFIYFLYELYSHTIENAFLDIIVKWAVGTPVPGVYW